MFLCNGAMDARFEDLCHRISHSLAFITSHHHRGDVDLFRSWRGLVLLCQPPYGDEDCAADVGDSHAFARCMWEKYLGEEQLPEREDAFFDVEHAYSTVYYDLQEMMRLVLQGAHPMLPLGFEQRRADLEECIRSIDARLHVLYSRVARKRVQRVAVLERRGRIGGGFQPACAV